MLPRCLISLILLAALPGVLLAQPTAHIRRAVQQELERRFPEAAPRLEVRLQRSGGDIPAHRPLRISFRDGDAVPRGHAQADVLTGSDRQGWHKTGWALLYVAHYDSVMVPRNDLRRDDPLPPSALSASWVETTRFRGQPLRPSDYRQLAKTETVYAKRFLQAGRALRYDDVRQPYAAQTGEAVVMFYERQSLTMRIDCKAREPGFLDETIRLYSPTTRATYRARLIAPNTARWIETL